ncbi:MAG: crossover junction endodeoxyribonuclease RuvC [Longimicrobiales bacterium]
MTTRHATRSPRDRTVIVLGVDPGAATTGYGVVARASGGAVSLRECGVVRTDPGEPLPDRLRCIYEGVLDVLERHAPSTVAIEGVFYARNVRSTVVLGQARGAVMLAASMRGLPVAEYSPAAVKNAVVGTGRATKDQVQYMIQQLLRLKTPPRPADAADAVAVALCHCHAGSLSARLAATATLR